jgi:hypothetical protein
MVYTTHGHHISNSVEDPDKPEKVVRCGGPGLCAQCSKEAIAYHQEKPPTTIKDETMTDITDDNHPDETSDDSPSQFKRETYFRKPYPVEAMQVTPESMAEVAIWCGGTIESDDDGAYIKVKVLRPPGS